jgi:signal transduction histidine kinase
MASRRDAHLKLVAGGRNLGKPASSAVRSRKAPAGPQSGAPPPAAHTFRDLQGQHATLLRNNQALARQLLESEGQLAAPVKDLREEVSRHGDEEHLLRDQMVQQRALNVESTLAEQREHRRLADLLSEELQQLLTAAKYKLALLAQSRQQIPPLAWADVSGLLDEAVRCSRSIGGDLSPAVLRPAELLPALCWLRYWMAERHQLHVELYADSGVEPAQEVVSLLLFQSVRELLCNTHKHAQVGTARVELTHQYDALQITVSDDGIGFDVAHLPTRQTVGLGLRSIRQRLEYLGGRLDITSAPGQGSRFTLMVPLHA